MLVDSLTQYALADRRSSPRGGPPLRGWKAWTPSRSNETTSPPSFAIVLARGRPTTSLRLNAVARLPASGFPAVPRRATFDRGR